MNSSVDLEATLSLDEKNAYKALIEGCGGAKSSMENDCGNNFDDRDEATYEIDELKVCFKIGYNSVSIPRSFVSWSSKDQPYRGLKICLKRVLKYVQKNL